MEAPPFEDSNSCPILMGSSDGFFLHGGVISESARRQGPSEAPGPPSSPLPCDGTVAGCNKQTSDRPAHSSSGPAWVGKDGATSLNHRQHRPTRHTHLPTFSRRLGWPYSAEYPSSTMCSVTEHHAIGSLVCDGAFGKSPGSVQYASSDREGDGWDRRQ